MSDQDNLETISRLSVEFGGPRYVRGGGGNTSYKNDSTLWIKPSGISLLELVPDKFVQLSRQRLNELYGQTFPSGDAARESAVKDFMSTTILPGQTGRPSVEAPLHNTFPQRFVVHTHPSVVNGMTCGLQGEEICKRLFPDALWVSFVEPGYTLAMVIRKAMLEYADKNGKAPALLFLGNHGVFIAHDEAEGIRSLYSEVMDKLESVVRQAKLLDDPEKKQEPDASAVSAAAAALQSALGENAAALASSGWFHTPDGALTPDHIVYCKSYMYKGDLNAAALAEYRQRHGYWPRVAETKDAVYGFGANQKIADLALEMAWDGALVLRYAGAFGGVKYLDKRFVDFIEGWEVESYRQRLMA